MRQMDVDMHATRADQYAYRVRWSAEDLGYVGTVVELPSLSFVAEDHETVFTAFDGIRRLVMDVLEDLRVNGESAPEPILDPGSVEVVERTEVLEAELASPSFVDLGGQQFVNPLQVAWLTGNGQAVDGSDSEDPATVIHLAGGGAIYVLLPVGEVVRRLQGDE